LIWYYFFFVSFKHNLEFRKIDYENRKRLRKEYK
jgi:hypothetical protein